MYSWDLQWWRLEHTTWSNMICFLSQELWYCYLHIKLDPLGLTKQSLRRATKNVCKKLKRQRIYNFLCTQWLITFPVRNLWLISALNLASLPATSSWCVFLCYIKEPFSNWYLLPMKFLHAIIKLSSDLSDKINRLSSHCSLFYFPFQTSKHICGLFLYPL